MISIREKGNEIILIQNNKWIYVFAKNTCFLFFTVAGIFNILKNNIEQFYLSIGVISIAYYLFMNFSKLEKKIFIKLYSQKLEILSDFERKIFLLDDIRKVNIEKTKTRKGILYTLKLELKNRKEEEYLLQSFYCIELYLVKKEILKYKNKGENNAIF